MRRRIRLAVFDLDGTLTSIDSLWRYLHDSFGTWDKGRISAQRYEQGEISYTEWAEADARCWKGISTVALTEVVEQVPYREGVREVFKHLRQNAVKTAIVSAGLSVLADKFAKELEADFVEANELVIDDGALSGGIRVKVSVVDKGRIVENIAAKASVRMQETALIGDRGNDLPLDDCLKIAFNPKDKLARDKADVVVEADDLSRLLPFLT